MIVWAGAREGRRVDGWRACVHVTPMVVACGTTLDCATWHMGGAALRWARHGGGSCVGMSHAFGGGGGRTMAMVAMAARILPACSALHLTAWQA